MSSFSLAKILYAMNEMFGIQHSRKGLNKKLGHEPTPQKKRRGKSTKPISNQRKKLIERKEKKRVKTAAESRKTNRLRGVGI